MATRGPVPAAGRGRRRDTNWTGADDEDFEDLELTGHVRFLLSAAARTRVGTRFGFCDVRRSAYDAAEGGDSIPTPSRVLGWQRPSACSSSIGTPMPTHVVPHDEDALRQIEAARPHRLELQVIVRQRRTPTVHQSRAASNVIVRRAPAGRDPSTRLDLARTGARHHDPPRPRTSSSRRTALRDWERCSC